MILHKNLTSNLLNKIQVSNLRGMQRLGHIQGNKIKNLNLFLAISKALNIL